MRFLAVVFVIVLGASVSEAQTLQKLGPNDSIRFSWPIASVSPDTLDAPDGYRVKAVSPTQAGVVIRSWDVAGATTTAWTLAPAQMPAGVFTVTVVPYNMAGEGPASNAIGPFGKVTTPKGLTGVTGSVVAGGSVSLVRPASGGVLATSTRTSTASITVTYPDDFERSFVYLTGENVPSSLSFRPENLSAFESLTFSPQVKQKLRRSTHESR